MNFLKSNIIWIIAVAAVFFSGVILFITSYNGLVDRQTEIEEKNAAISVQLQRRADLIPNFVATVKGYSEYEQETFTAVTKARAAVKDADTPKEQAAASARLDGAIDVWVNAITEAYPELKANTQYIALQDELAGTENRISYARDNYNEAVKEYNKAIKKFPRSIIAGIFNFEAAEFFEADGNAAEVPQVSFD